MGKRIILSLVSVMLTSMASFSQDYAYEILPLRTTTTDVLKHLGKPSKIAGEESMSFELAGRVVSITSYSKGCDADTEKRLGLTRGIVLAVKIVPTLREKTADVVVTLSEGQDNTQFFGGPGGESLLYDAEKGIVVISEGGDPYSAVVKEIYRVPPKGKLDGCILELLGENSGIDRLELFGAVARPTGVRNFPAEETGSYFESDSPKAKERVVSRFVGVLAERNNGIGIISVSSRKNEPSSQASARKYEVIQKLISKGVECSRLVVLETHGGKDSRTSFLIMPKSSAEKAGYPSACSIFL